MHSAVADDPAGGTSPPPPAAAHHRRPHPHILTCLPARNDIDRPLPLPSSSPPSLSLSADWSRPSPPLRSDSPLQHHLVYQKQQPPHHHQHHFGTFSPPHSGAMVTPEEYQSLPPSIQKKYFSSVERLRIAQQSAVQKRKKHQPQSKEQWLSPKPSMDSIRPKTAHSSKGSTFSYPKKSASFRRMEADVDEEQALRFMALPDKVKRSQFSPEEVYLLTQSSEKVLGCPSPMAEDGLQRRSTMDRKGSLCSSRQRSSISDEMGEDVEKYWLELETDSIHSFERSVVNDGELVHVYPQRQSSASSMFSAPRQTIPRSESERLEPGRKSSFAKRRAFSLAPIPLPPPTLRPAVPHVTSSSTLDNSAKPVQSPETTPTEKGISTKYYKDSQARQKLREYLASPEKFDEALEFGFPTEPGATGRTLPHSPKSDIPLHGEMDELCVDDNRAGEEETSVASPRIPSTNNDAFSSGMTYHSSLDSGVAIPVNIGKTSARSLSPDINGREMTLRMTLTRPDLRAPEQQLYAFQRKEVSGVDIETSDPLALSSLPVCDDHTGAHGAFAVSKPPSGGTSIKKVWKNIRGR